MDNRLLNQKTGNIYLYGFIVITLFFIYHLIGSVVFWIAGALLLVVSLFFNLKKQIKLVFFLMASESILKLSGLTYSVLGYYYFLIGGVCLLKNLKNISRTYIAVCFLHLLTIVMSSIFVESFSNLLSFIRTAILAFFVLFCWKNKQISCEEVVKNFLYGVLIAVVYGIIFSSFNGTLDNGLFGGVSGGRNYFGVLTSVSVTLCVLYLTSNKLNPLEKVSFVLVLLISGISIVLSGSRTVTISLVFPIIILLYKLFSLKNFKAVLFTFIVIGIVGYVLITNFSNSISFIVERFNSDDVETGNGRFNIWSFYLNKYINSGIGILIGNGSSNLIYHSGEIKNVAHNTLVEYIYCGGILGCATILWFIIYIFKQMNCGKSHKDLTLFMPLGSVCFCYFGIDGVYSDQLLLLLLLSFMIIFAFNGVRSQRRSCPNENNTN